MSTQRAKTQVFWAAFTDELQKIADVEKTRTLSAFEKELEPGDVLLTSLNKPQSMKGRVFRRLSNIIQGDRGHAALYAGDGKVFETQFGEKAKLKHLRQVVQNRDVSAYRPKATAEQKIKALQRAREMLGAPYGGTFGVFTKMLLSKYLPLSARKPKDTKDRLYCSNMVTRAYDTSFGLKRHPELIYPSELLSAPKLTHVAEFRNWGRHQPGSRKE